MRMAQSYARAMINSHNGGKPPPSQCSQSQQANVHGPSATEHKQAPKERLAHQQACAARGAPGKMGQGHRQGPSGKVVVS
jgi:hypothetical protein